MPLQIVRNDITTMKVDAIVNAANETLLGGGGVDGCIHRAAGKELVAECRLLGGCTTGEAKITKGYRLPAKFVIHTVGPIWRGGQYGEKELLTSCYRNSLQLAVQHQCESIAFPLVSAGVYGYPKDQALRVAAKTIQEFLAEHEMQVYIVIFDKRSYQIGKQLFSDIEEYIDERYVDERIDEGLELARRQRVEYLESLPQWHSRDKEERKEQSLHDLLENLDESFVQMLLRKIDERGMSDAQCYKKANIDRRLFSKIRSNEYYKPSKPTAIALAIALELSLEEVRDFLGKAGFALSHSSKFDLIIEYFIERKNYNVFEINEALFAFDQPLIGG